MKKLLIGILVTVGFLSSSLLFAQDTEELEVKGKVLQSDQVTAFKTPVPVLNVPQSVSIITDDEIRKKGYRELGDVVRYTPGVNTTQGESQAKDGARSGGILPDYTRWDAAGYWTLSDDLSVQLNIENLTDTVYFPHAHSTHQISVGEEMNARVSLNYSF